MQRNYSQEFVSTIAVSVTVNTS